MIGTVTEVCLVAVMVAATLTIIIVLACAVVRTMKGGGKR